MTARECADALVMGWISRHGVQTELTTDIGTQFTWELWAALCTTLGIHHITTTSFHPQSNGMVEWSHRQLKDALGSCMAGSDWLDHLPWVLLGLRLAPKEDSAVSSAELVYGAPLTLPVQFLAAPEPPAEVFL